MKEKSKTLFFDDNESDSEIKTKNEYAKNYDTWRKKEELNKLKNKYGENYLEDSESSSSSDDEDAVELTEEVEKDFFKTLSYLKTKNPKIYDSSVSFFKNKVGIQKEKKKKEAPMFLKDYERKLLLEKDGIIEEHTHEGPTYAEEEKKLQEEIIKQASKIEEEEDTDLGGLLHVRKKTDEESKKEAEYLKWLTGQTNEIEDEEIKTELKPLKDFWNNPGLTEGEKFLRDYVLKKRYLEKEDDEYVPTYDEILHDSDESLSGDEDAVEKQEEFEHKYNFRFEEPDQEFIKRYPRTIEKSLRKTDDRRKLKRAEIKERKKKEKEEKMAEIKQLQELKRKEIEEKIEKLKEITGNEDVGFQEDDIEGDFDPEAHDKRMQSLFNDDFYEGQEGDQKPEFPDIDEELEIENWDHWDDNDNKQVDTEHELHCEDETFNMDADYDPSTSTKKELLEKTKGKKRRRKSKVAEALSKPKPKYDPADKNYEKYFDEYYKLDCEDIIGNIPCRFKYREVIPNNFGLSIEEILLAKDKELNRWCSIKKAVQYRPPDVEKYDQIAYSKKANNVNLKKRILPSLFSDEADDNTNMQQPSVSSQQETNSNSMQNFNNTVISESISRSTSDDNLEASKDGKKSQNPAEKNKKKKTPNKNTGKNSKITNLQQPVVSSQQEINSNSIEDLNNTVISESISKSTSDDNLETRKDSKKLQKPNKKNKKKKIPKKNTSKNSEIINLQQPSTSIQQETDSNRINDSNKTVISEPISKSTSDDNLDSGKDGKNPTEKRKDKTAKKKNKKKKTKKNISGNSEIIRQNIDYTKKDNEQKVGQKTDPNKTSKKNNRKRKLIESERSKDGAPGKKLRKNKGAVEVGISDARLSAYGINPKKFKNKLKYGSKTS